MKRIFTFLALILMCILAKAQQDPHFSHFMFNQVSYNPGFCGTSGMINAVAINRNQWMGMEGSPKTLVFCADMPVNYFGQNAGLGFTIQNDKIGFEDNFVAKIGYSHHFSLGPGLLSFGVDGGLFNKAIDGDWKFPDQVEAIFEGKTRKMLFDLGAGVYYNINNLTCYVSGTHLTAPELDFDTDGLTYLQRHFYFGSEYNIILENSLFDITPGFILMTDTKKYQFDINFMVSYNKKIRFGVTYRNQDAISILAGAKIFGDFNIGIAYELGISKLRKANMGSLEFMLGYSFMPEKSKPAQMSRSVRFL